MLEELNKLISKVNSANDQDTSMMLHYIIGCYAYHASLADANTDHPSSIFKEESAITKSFIQALSGAITTREEVQKLIAKS